MPCYSISPFPQRRQAVHYSPYQAFFGAPQVTLAPRYPSYSYGAPALFRTLEADLASFDNFFQEINQQVAAAAKAVTPAPFQPKFDVKDEGDKFILHGELQGIQPEHLSVEFADKNTLVVKGKLVKQETHNAPTEQAPEQQPQVEPAQDQDVTMSGALPESTDVEDFVEVEKPSTPSTNYHKASVSDDEGEEAPSGSATPASSEQQPLLQDAAEQEPTAPTAEQQVSQPAPQEPQTQPQQAQNYSRTEAEFTRAFRFPGKVDQEAVKASFKEGILKVEVPKYVEKVQGRRSIQINSE